MPEAPATVAPAVSLGPRSLLVEGRELPFFAGGMHYAGVSPQRLAAGLRAMRSLGYTVVEAPVPWSVHETAPGRFDFSGKRDLRAFLDAASAEGLAVALRVGPRVGGELTHGGLPARIVNDAALQARTAAGHPRFVLDVPRAWAAPSYGAMRFLDEVRRLYGALGEVIAPRLWPAGPVVMLHVDHQLGGFLRAGAYCGDYHSEVLADWHSDEGPEEPPRRFDPPSEPIGLLPHLRWLRFRERQTTSTLRRLGGLLGEAGLGGALRAHAFSSLEPVTWDVAAAEHAVSVASAGFLFGRRQQARTLRLARYLAGSSRLPLAAPLALGSMAWGPSLDDEDGVCVLLGALMGGAVGYSASAAMAHDRWVGAPIDEEGAIRPAPGQAIRRIHAALVAAQWTMLHRTKPIGLVVPRDYGRLSLLSSRLGPLAPLGERFGFGAGFQRDARYGFAGPVQSEFRAAEEAISGALGALGLPFVLLDESAVPERLESLGAVVALSFDFADRALHAALGSFAARGGQVLWGPRRPSLDEQLAPIDESAFRFGERFDAALLGDAPALRSALGSFAARVGIEPERAGGGASGNVASAATGAGLAEVRIERRSDGTPVLLFVRNPGATAISVTVEVGAHATCVTTAQRFAGPHPTIPLAPFEVRLLALE